MLANSNSKRLSERAGLFVVYEISMDHYKLQNLYCGKAFKKPFDWNNPSKPLYTYEIAEDISTTRNNQEKYYQELRRRLTASMSKFKLACLVLGLSIIGIIILGACMYGYYLLDQWLSGFTPSWARAVIRVLIAGIVMAIGVWTEVKSNEW